MITQELCNQLFNYCDGELFWKINAANNVKIGYKAGFANTFNYRIVGINGKNYKIHRIVFLMHYGYLPRILDHIDGNRSNNKIENLREANFIQNAQNAKIQKNNKSGFKGVSWDKNNNKWRVCVSIDGKQKHIKFFDDLELADLVAQEARNKYHGNFAKHF